MKRINKYNWQSVSLGIVSIEKNIIEFKLNTSITMAHLTPTVQLCDTYFPILFFVFNPSKYQLHFTTKTTLIVENLLFLLSYYYQYLTFKIIFSNSETNVKSIPSNLYYSYYFKFQLKYFF